MTIWMTCVPKKFSDCRRMGTKRFKHQTTQFIWRKMFVFQSFRYSKLSKHFQTWSKILRKCNIKVKKISSDLWNFSFLFKHYLKFFWLQFQDSSFLLNQEIFWINDQNKLSTDILFANIFCFITKFSIGYSNLQPLALNKTKARALDRSAIFSYKKNY